MKMSDLLDFNQSHLPVLQALAKVKKIEKVVETGSGLNSTPFFLDKNNFPDLMLLTTLEHNASWAQTVRSQIKADGRWNYVVQSSPMYDIVRAIVISGYHLCLIDDSSGVHERANTIRVVTNGDIGDAIIVIHDFEHDDYQNAVNKKLNVKIVWDNVPKVGICWLGNVITDLDLAFINKEIL